MAKEVDLDKLTEKWGAMSLEDLEPVRVELQEEAEAIRATRHALAVVLDTKRERRRLSILTGYSEGALAILTDEQIRALVEESAKAGLPEGSVTAEVNALKVDTKAESPGE